MPTCPQCQQTKPTELFKKTSTGIYCWCKACHSKRQREHNEANRSAINTRRRKQRRERPSVFKSQELKKLYGLTGDQYDSLLSAQGGVCAICGEPETEKRNGRVKALSIDHDHVTNLIRGLLCGYCNKSLGMIETSPSFSKPAFVERAMKYAAEPVAWTVLGKIVAARGGPRASHVKERHPSKLSDVEVLAMRLDHVLGESRPSLCLLYDVSINTVNKIVRYLVRS